LNLSGYVTGIRTDSDFLGLGIAHNPGYARFDLATSYLIARGVSFTGRVTNLFDKAVSGRRRLSRARPQFSSRPQLPFCR